MTGYISSDYSNKLEETTFTGNNIVLSSSLSISISVITLLLLLFIYISDDIFDIVSILTLSLFTR